MAATAIPRIVHFVWGLKDVPEPFHLVHYLCIESCRRLLRPEAIVLHYRFLPFGVYWDLAAPHLTPRRVGLASEVTSARYDGELVPQELLYAHHSDFVRLDALIEQGGVYADIDTLFVRPFPDEWFAEQFVIGHEDPIRDQLTDELRPSLCNALLLSAPDSEFARTWRSEMAGALNGTWSNHSTLLPYELSRRLPGSVRVEPLRSFFAYGPSRHGLASLFERDEPDTDGIYSLHLWSHLWWDAARRDLSDVHAGQLTPEYVRTSESTYARLARPFLPDLELW